MNANSTLPSDNMVFNWLDVNSPTQEHLQELATQYHLPEMLIKDCLEPKHLPKYEKTGDLFFMILRVYDKNVEDLPDTVQNLTRKIAVFYRPEFLITIHRSEHEFLSALREEWVNHPKDYTSLKIFSKIIFGALSSYQPPIEDLIRRYEELDIKIFSDNIEYNTINEGYPIKRQAFLLKRLLKLTDIVINRLGDIYFKREIFLEDLKDLSSNLYFQVDELSENIVTALNLDVNILSQQISRSSQRLNEIMRVLTIFSTFILPLSLVTGIYGMNFDYMPELRHKYGYPICLLSMASISGLIYWWMKRKKLF